MAFALENTHWYWFSAGILLIALEALAPGAVLIWFGIAALLTGVLTLTADWSLNSELIFFSVVAISSTVAFKFWQKRHPPEEATSDSGSGLNHPGRDLIGRTLVLATDLQDGSGRVKYADSTWRCTGPNLPVGSAVQVTAIKSGTLVVIAAPQPDKTDQPDA